eukprot:scaffold26445_cov55-Phaeocystis_antarctica.AAC.2
MDPCCAQPGGAQHGRLGGIWCVVKTREPGGGSVRKERVTPSRSALTHSLTSRRAWRQVVEVLEPDLADGDVRLEERGDAACVRRGGGRLGVAAVQQHAHLVRVR